MFWAISLGIAFVNTFSGIVLGAVGVLGQVGAVIGLILPVVFGGGQHLDWFGGARKTVA